MHFKEYQPPLGLKPYLRYYWTLQLNSIPVSYSSQRILTESFELTFNLEAPIEIVSGDGQAKCISETGIIGPMSQPMRLIPTGPVNLFGICFRPAGGYPFFRYPTHELSNRILDVDDLWGTKGREVVEHIQYDCSTIQSRIEAINAYLTRLLESNLHDDVIIKRAIEIIENCNGCVNINQLARHLGLSHRHLSRKFKDRLGMTPKQLCRNTRFKKVYKLIEMSSYHNWADVALTCGYYDQSHFINEFKYFTGISPEAYFFSSPNSPDFFTANF